MPIDTLQFAPSEQAAIAIIGITAYATGFEIFMARQIRPGIPGLDEDPTPEMLSRSRTDPLAVPFFSLLLSDGTKVISGTWSGESRPTGPILRSHGGGGSTHSQFLRWWAWPLPPKGPLEFICQWPMYEITETRVGIDAQLIIDAAQRSIRLWSEEKELPSAEPSRGSPPHPEGAQEEGDEEQADTGEQQVQQALHDDAQDTQRHRRDHQQQKQDKHPVLHSAELVSGEPAAAHGQRPALVGHCSDQVWRSDSPLDSCQVGGVTRTERTSAPTMAWAALTGLTPCLLVRDSNPGRGMVFTMYPHGTGIYADAGA